MSNSLASCGIVLTAPPPLMKSIELAAQQTLASWGTQSVSFRVKGSQCFITHNGSEMKCPKHLLVHFLNKICVEAF